MKNANTPVWTGLMLGYGKSTDCDDGKLQTDIARGHRGGDALSAADDEVGTARGYRIQLGRMPVGFLQGKVAMWLDGVGFAPPLENPQKSRVVGKVGYGVMPKGPTTQAAPTFGDGIGVTEASTKKEAAYLYCQWAISKEMGARLLQAGSGVPFRNSILNDRRGPQGRHYATGSGSMPCRSLHKVSQLALPVIIPVTEFRDIMGVGLTNLLGGADPCDRNEAATEDFRPMLARSET